jgi:16S rRNA (guanine527-N7)-methyltransferase
MAQLWLRHIVDSAQLLRFASAGTSWVDLGTGAGFPGLIVAALHDGPVTLVEERRLRVDFLRRAAGLMDLRIEILHARAERVPPRPYDVISARAFAPLEKLLMLGTAFSTQKSLWLLPKGRNAETELAALDPSWQGSFRLEPSVTDAEAQIIVAESVTRRLPRRTGKDKRR